jgi:ABC-type branched-subunit amino acid transport system substrate-binding protein
MIIVLCLLCLSTFSVAKTPIKLGSSIALTGPNSFLGIQMQKGMLTYFKKINAKGGVFGRKIELIALDDGYIPEIAKKNTLQLIDGNNVLALIGNVGTPTARVTVPVVNEKKILLFGAYTGSDILRKNPPDRYVINYRAGYSKETENMLNGLIKMGIRPFEIAFFTQIDSYGDVGYYSALNTLERLGYSNGASLPHGRYTRNTTDIKDAVIKILNAEIKPKAIIMVGTYAPCAKFISIAKRVLPCTYFLNISFTGTNALKMALGGKTKNVIVTQVVPGPQANYPIVHEYKKDLKKYFPKVQPGFVSLEGYIVAKIFVEGLKRTKGKITRETIIDALESLKDLDVGLSEKLTYGPDKHEGLKKVWPIIFNEKSYELFHWKVKD